MLLKFKLGNYSYTIHYSVQLAGINGTFLEFA